MNQTSDLKSFYALFPKPALAKDITTTITPAINNDDMSRIEKKLE